MKINMEATEITAEMLLEGARLDAERSNQPTPIIVSPKQYNIMKENLEQRGSIWSLS